MEEWIYDIDLYQPQNQTMCAIYCSMVGCQSLGGNQLSLKKDIAPSGQAKKNAFPFLFISSFTISITFSYMVCFAGVSTSHNHEFYVTNHSWFHSVHDNEPLLTIFSWSNLLFTLILQTVLLPHSYQRYIQLIWTIRCHHSICPIVLIFSPFFSQIYPAHFPRVTTKYHFM